MDKPKITYRFHNPNEGDEFMKVFLKVIIEANMKRVDEAVRKGLEECEEHDKSTKKEKNI